MSCRIARDLLQAYLDSELETAQTLAVNRHLEQCAACRRRYESERRIEGAIAQRLRAGPTGDTKTVAQVLDRVAGRSRAARRALPWLQAAAALLVALLLSRSEAGVRLPELIRVAAADHEKYRSGRMGPHLPATDAESVRGYLEPLLGVACDALPDSPDWRIVGPRLCRLKGAPVGLVMLERQGRPVSLFVVPRDSARALSWEPGGPPRRFSLGDAHAVVADEGDTVRCALGALPVAELERLVIPR